MKMSMIKVSLLVVLVLAPLATQLAWAAAPADEAKKPEWMIPIRIGGLRTPSVAMIEAFRCLSSLTAYGLDIFSFILRGTPLSKVACDDIRGLPASCTDALNQILGDFGVPFNQTLAHCGASAPSPL